MTKTPEAFMEYFRTNYPGPNTVISKPDWHAPKIYAAAIHASGHKEVLEALKAMCEFWRHAIDATGDPTPEDEKRVEQLAVMAHDAIAKAEGLIP